MALEVEADLRHRAAVYALLNTTALSMAWEPDKLRLLASHNAHVMAAYGCRLKNNIKQII